MIVDHGTNHKALCFRGKLLSSLWEQRQFDSIDCYRQLAQHTEINHSYLEGSGYELTKRQQYVSEITTLGSDGAPSPRPFYHFHLAYTCPLVNIQACACASSGAENRWDLYSSSLHPFLSGWRNSFNHHCCDITECITSVLVHPAP